MYNSFDFYMVEVVNECCYEKDYPHSRGVHALVALALVVLVESLIWLMPVWGLPPGKGRSVTSDRREVVSNCWLHISMAMLQ